MDRRNNGYLRSGFLSKSCEGYLQDCDIASSSSSNLEESSENSNERFDVFGRLINQIRGLKTASKSYDSILAGQNRRQNSREGELTEQDVMQVDAFFRSHKTSVFVCRSLANLYFSKGNSNWELARTGVPVLLLDRGETRARSQRLIQIVLAEKGTGFVLWRDVINGRTNYRVQDTTFHVMFVSGDRTRSAGLRFDLMSAAMEFFEKVEQLVGDPLNLSLMTITTNKKKRRPSSKKNKTEAVCLPRKCDISQPCCFQHVTNVAIDDKDRLYTLATLLANRRN